ncbi:cell wall-binding repeat-containing protein, partial [Mobiluncus curtisii]
GLAGVSVAPAQAADLPFERLAGPSGVETSLAVAKHTWGTDWKVVYVASNRNPVDALPAATIGDGPVVLTDGKGLNLGGVKPGKIIILGGVGAVPQAIEDQAKASGAEVVRLAGADRNATAVSIAKQWVKVNGTPKNVYVTKNTGSGS